MLPVSLLNALKQYSLAQRTLPSAAVDAVAKTGVQFDLGQKLQGNVQAQVAPNIFKVNVAGQLVQMQLPSSIKSGDTVALQVVSLQPRLTFSMVNSASPLSSPEQLGATARMLSSLSQQAPEKAYVRAAQSTPLWETPQPPETRQLAAVLQETLSNSGLFYESHQAQWLGGERTTAQLLLEPQNLIPEQAKIMAAGSPANKTTATGESDSKSVIVEVAAGKVILANDNPGRTVAAHANADSNSPTPLNSPAMQDNKPVSIPDHLQPLVQQQLNALETSQLMWQGNVWPGQDMQWEVHEQVPQHSTQESQRQWVTQIQLDLPNLGVVAATLRFNSAGLSLTLNADTQQTRTLLGNASSGLVSALSQAGISVLSTQVSTET
jgi:hypothetical protein